MTRREQQVLAVIRENPLISQDAIAEKLRISRSSVAGHIMRLVAKGVIKGRGYVIDDEPFVVAIGGANMDICGAPHGELRAQDSNPGQVTSSPGGVARNIAENLARLGVDCRLITAIGADHYGELLIRQAEAAGINMRYVLRLEERQTSTYVSVLDAGGDMLVGINDMSIIDHLRPEQLQTHELMLRQARAIVADTNLCEASLAYLSETFVEQPLFVDTVSVAKAARIKPSLASIHTLKASRTEAEALSAVRCTSNKRLPHVADWFHNRGVERVFITLGPEGVFYSDANEQGIEKTGKQGVEVANANGAGDAFLAGMTYSWLKKHSLIESVRFAISAANITLSHRATINPMMSAAAITREKELQYSA